MVVKDGFRFVQGLIPMKMHKELTRVSRETGQSKAEIIRRGISLYFDSTKSCTRPEECGNNTNQQCPGGCSHGRIE